MVSPVFSGAPREEKWLQMKAAPKSCEWGETCPRKKSESPATETCSKPGFRFGPNFPNYI